MLQKSGAGGADIETIARQLNIRIYKKLKKTWPKTSHKTYLIEFFITSYNTAYLAPLDVKLLFFNTYI